MDFASSAKKLAADWLATFFGRKVNLPINITNIQKIQLIYLDNDAIINSRRK